MFPEGTNSLNVSTIHRGNRARPNTQPRRAQGERPCGTAVLVSSQNYSADGVRFNRDAGLLIRHADVAAYFGTIFLHDWDNRTSRRIAGEAGGMPLVAEVAADRAASARGAAEPISWDEFYGG